MKITLRTMVVLSMGLLLLWLGLTMIYATTVNARTQVATKLVSSMIQTGLWTKSSQLTHMSGTIPFTSTSTLYLPILATACTLTPNLPPHTAMVRSDALLYAGPSNIGYDVIAHLKACTTVSAQAVYGHFVKVEVSSVGGAKLGFLYEQSLLFVPKNLTVLNQNLVAWQAQDLINHFALDSDVVLQGNDIVVDNSSHNYYNDVLPISLTLNLGFKLTFQFATDSSLSASIKLADKQNNNTSDWWRDIRRVDFLTDNGQLKIDLRDGISQNSSTRISLGLPDSQTTSVTFLDPFGKVFIVTDQNNHEIRRIDVTRLSGVNLPQGLFPERVVYFGRVAPPNAKLTIKSLSLHLVPDGEWKQLSPVALEPTLRHLAEAKSISVGTDYGGWLMRNPLYWDAMFSAYNTAILSDFSSTTFWRGRGDYDFVPLDRTIDWLVKNGFRTRASHLVWGEYNIIPNWLLNGNFSHDDYTQILHEHINTVVGHYKGRINEWSIANEAVGRSFSAGNDFWADKIGPDYVEMAFRWAREADPVGTLIFNDDNNNSLKDPASEPVTSKMLDMVRNLKGKGVPIDIVGMQMHLFLPWNSQEPPIKADVIDTMQQFANLGVKIYITEFDVNLHNIAGTHDERWAFEAQQYHNMVSACLESSVCTSFATWGISDSNSWLSCTDGWWCLKSTDAEPLMFDGSYQLKPAYHTVYDVFTNFVPPQSK